MSGNFGDTFTARRQLERNTQMSPKPSGVERIFVYIPKNRNPLHLFDEGDLLFIQRSVTVPNLYSLGSSSLP
ncbi:MAG: hypothetical protein AB8B69_14550 [Chitinophagales bacterium]